MNKNTIWTREFKKKYYEEYNKISRVLKMGKKQREEARLRLENKKLFEQLQSSIFAHENVEGEIL